MEKYGCSNVFLKWMNLFTLILSLPIIGVGAWLYTSKGSECYTFLQKPVLVLGCFMFIYLFLMGVLIILLLAFTLFAFIVTSTGGGTNVENQRFKEYDLKDYSSWLRSNLNDTGNWKKMKACMSQATYCDHLNYDYPTVPEYLRAKLSPTEAGCCRPPASCAYKQLNATYFTISAPKSANADCVRYSNDPKVECFDCDSCKAGVAQYLKTEWNLVAIVLVVILFLLIILYAFACCAKYNADRDLEFERIDKL
eukprot:jgi/Mesen1/6786/ME000348S06045